MGRFWNERFEREVSQRVQITRHLKSGEAVFRARLLTADTRNGLAKIRVAHRYVGGNITGIAANWAGRSLF